MIKALVVEERQEYGLVDYDGLWKKLIYELFEEFILYFIPDLFEEIDFLREPEFLQQELFKEIIQEKKGKQVADQIVKVFLKSGEEKWILIHIEVQGDPDPHFSKRMFHYYYRIFDKFDQDIVAIALLTDESKRFRPESYRRSSFGTTITYEYNIYKFADQSETELLKSSNPFAIAVLAAKYVNMTKNDNETRYRFKRRLIKFILQKTSYPRADKHIYLAALFYFIDYFMRIPKELTEKLRDELILTKEEFEMIYLDRKNPPQTVGEIRKEAREEGRQENRKQNALEMLKDGMSVELVAKYVKLTVEEVKKLRD